MRKIFPLLLYVAIFCGSHSYAQIKAKNIWPVTNEISIKNFHLNYRASEGDIIYQFFLNECIEGNCKNGEGVWASTNSRKVEFRDNGSLELTVNLYKGTFSEDGKQFKGKKLVYNYTLSGSGAKSRDFYANKFTPLSAENLANDLNNSIAASKYIVAEGEAIRTEGKMGDKTTYGYTLHGIGASREAMTELGAASMQGKYENGQLLMANITVQDNFPAKSFTGKMNFKNKPLVGKLEFKDGTRYEGFFYDGKYNGPGKLVGSDGKTIQGFWDNGILKDSQEVNLPSSLWDYNNSAASASKPFTITIGDKPYTGIYVGEWKDGKPHGKGLFSMPSNTFFYGRFENGMANGLGYFYSLYKTETWACCQRQAEYVLSGLFTNNWLTYGNKSIYDYMWYTSSADPNYTKGFIPQESNLFSGTFKNHNLDGCGKTVSKRFNIEPELSKTMTGTYKDGGLHGWATIDYPLKRQDDKWKGKYFGYFIYHPVSPYAVKQDLISSFYSSTTPSDPIKYYSNYEKEIETFLKEITAGESVCDNIIISEADKKKYIQDAKELGLYARKLVTNYKNQPPPTTLVSTYDIVVKKLKYPEGTKMRLKREGYSISVVTGYNFDQQLYKVSTGTIKAIYGKTGNYKGSKDATDIIWVSEKDIDARYNIEPGMYHICSTCNGTGYTTGTVHGGNQGGWEKWTDNVFYNRPSTAYSYEVTTGCGSCKTVGWR